MLPQYTTNWPVVGHELAIQRVAQAMNSGRLRHAYLITGPAGIGKTTFARAFAQAVNCEHDEYRPCGVCRACVHTAQETYADYSLIQADGNSLKIDQIRDMQRILSLSPVEGRYRVVVLRRFQEANPQAMDALLKTLEEPPPYVLLLLTADTTETLLATIKSRCQIINLRPLPSAQVREALEQHLQVEPEQAALLAQLASGRMGWAANAARDETTQTQRKDWLARLEEALNMTRAGRFGMVEPLSKDKEALIPMLELWQSYWRDVLLLANHAVTPITNRDHRHALDQIARTVRVEDALRVLQAIRRTARYIGQNVNARLAMEVLMLDLPRLRLYASPPG